MESVKRLANYGKGYQHVADFQRLCGVEAVEVNKLVEQNGNASNNETDTNGRNGTKQRLTTGTNGSSKGQYKNGLTNPDGHETELAYRINNKFIYHLMHFGAGMGSETFYIIFFPFLLWNVDTQLTRCMLLIWYPLMYFGQFLKDYIQWPRPGPPAVRLEGKRFEMEYGMPSTHTIVGTCIPFTLLVLTSKQYEYSFYLGLAVALVWTGLVASSRVYLGMHTALDCLAGISMTALALPGMLAKVEWVDYVYVRSPFAPIFSFLIPLLACIYYPKPKVWSITRGDTSNIVSIGSVMLLSSWIMYHIGMIQETPRSTELLPLPQITLEWVGLSVLRMLLGVVFLASSRIVTKKIFVKFVCTCAGVDTKDIERQRELGLEVPVRWLHIGCMALNTAVTMPLIFSYLGICRPNFFNEVGL